METPLKQPLDQQRIGRVLVLTLNRPDRLNALTPALHDELLAALQAAAQDRNVGAVVLTGAGRAFCAGGDLGGGKSVPASPEGPSAQRAASPRPSMEEKTDSLLHHAESPRLLHGMPKPTIAMLNGVAAGAGLALALACDLRIASPDAVLTTAYAKVALSGDLGASYFLCKLVGPSKARELLFLSEKLDAAEAMKLGLINRLEENARLRETTMALATRLAEGPAVAFRYMKQNVLLAESEALDRVLEQEAYGMARSGRTQDAKEAAIAFREKRAPLFKGI